MLNQYSHILTKTDLFRIMSKELIILYNELNCVGLIKEFIKIIFENVFTIKTKKNIRVKCVLNTSIDLRTRFWYKIIDTIHCIFNKC